MPLFKTLLIFLFVTFSVVGQDTEDIPVKQLNLVLGIDKIIKLDFAFDTRLQIGDESKIQTQMAPALREITLTPRAPGQTSLNIRNKAGTIKAKYIISITQTDQSKTVSELKEFLGDIEGLEIGIKGESVYVGGEIVVPADIGKIMTILKLEKFVDVLILVEISPQTQRLIAKKMQEEIQKNQLRDVTVRVVNGLYWLEGVVSSEGEKTRAEQIAIAFFPDQLPSLAERTGALAVAKKAHIQNFIQINAKQTPPPIPKLVKITAQFVELTRDYKRVFGFKWQPLLSEGQGALNFGRTASDGLTTRTAGTLSGTISNLIPKLSSAKSAGFARVIQSGVVISKDNTDAHLEKTETTPFSLGTGEFTRSESASAGFVLDVRPIILQEEKIELKNLSLNVTATVGNPPQTLKNNVKTNLVVKSKESAVVGGIVVNKNATAFDKDPPGGADTAEEGSSSLFSFVRSKARTNTKSQFVVFVTPEIIESASQGAADIKRKFRQRRR